MNEAPMGFEFIASLPPSTLPWKIYPLEHGVVIANPEHPPRIVRRDGTVELLKFPPE